MKSATRRNHAVIPLGDFTKSRQVWEIEEKLADLSSKQCYKVIADLTGVAHISSSILGVLTQFSEECQQHNGELRLVVTEPGVQNLLQVTMLDRVFEIYNSLEEAEEDF